MSRYTDTELLDALEYYAWRVEGVCLPDGYRYTVRADVFSGPVLGEGRTWREALSAALNRASEGETRAERCRPGQSGGIRAIFGQWPGDETDEEVQAWLEGLS